MEKVKQYKFVILIAIIILGFAFYWFEWRPGKIRARCLTEGEFAAVPLEFTDNKRFEFIVNYYLQCVRRFGLEK